MSEITILFLYLLAAVAFVISRLPRFDARAHPALVAAFGIALAGLLLHAQYLRAEIFLPSGLVLSIELSLIHI